MEGVQQLQFLALMLQILTGFLGSGKTTLLNNVLSKNHGRRIAIIENEVCPLRLTVESMIPYN